MRVCRVVALCCMIIKLKQHISEKVVANFMKAKDSYLEGRQLEAKARKENSAVSWLAFADVKMSKGSYTLAVMGFLNAGGICEAAGDDAAIEIYQKGLTAAMKGKLKESTLLLAFKLAGLHERALQFVQAAAIYEQLSIFCEEQGAYFLAADASEHAAEMLLADGRDLSGYCRPAQLWLCNAEFWVGKDASDEAWSRRRADLYLKSIKK